MWSQQQNRVVLLSTSLFVARVPNRCKCRRRTAGRADLGYNLAPLCELLWR